MACDSVTLINLVASRKLCGLSLRCIEECIAYQSSQHSFIAVTTVIVNDGLGNFWLLIVDPAGNVGAQADPGPATPDVILADGFGGFWQLIINPGGLVGSTSVVLPATTPPVLSDGAGGFWTIIVDQFGNIGASLI